MEILFVQKAPCIRNLKIAQALRLKGYKVDLAYTASLNKDIYGDLSENSFNNCFKINTIKELRELAGEEYDIVHSHNEPDDLTIALLSVKVPLIHDSHDMISLRPTWNKKIQHEIILKEAVAQRGATGRVYVSDFMLQTAQKRYSINIKKSIIYGNYVNKDDMPAQLPERINEKGIHIVYQGGLGPEGTHRDFHNIFKSLTDAQIHLHVYPAAHTFTFVNRLQSSPYLHVHSPKQPSQIIEEIAKYDFGIIPFNIFPENRLFLNQSMPNKLFEYLAAGLPVIAPRLYSLEKFLDETGVGIVYDNPAEIPDQFNKLTEIKKTKEIQKFTKTHNEEIKELIDFYRHILEGD